MLLSEIIKQKICKDGPLSFCDFMEMCLYHPGLGYYVSENEKTGCNGDYYTSPYLTAIFGEMIGKQIEEMWELMGKKKFTIVEYGAGTGLLCHHILNRLRMNKEFYDCLNYCIIEKSGAMREMEKKILQEKVSWHESIRDIAPVTGCILSNEMIDNFSVHRVIMEDKLMEVFVDWDNEFVELLKPASPRICDYFEELRISLPKGFQTEANLQATEWIEEIGNALRTGFVITIDYGFSSEELYSMKRNTGTIICYHKHRINDNLYSNIGQQDITAHVNFSALHHWGLKYGLKYGGFTNQSYFLLALGLTDYLRKKETQTDNVMDTMRKASFINSFLIDMGTKLKVLMQYKNMLQPNLSGMKLLQPLA